MKKLLEKVKGGLGFAIGIFIIIGIVFGVYAFVEPTQSPTAGNNYISTTSPLIQKLNNIESNVTSINNKYGGCYWTGSATCFAGFTTVGTDTQYVSIFNFGAGRLGVGLEPVNTLPSSAYNVAYPVNLCCSN